MSASFSELKNIAAILFGAQKPFAIADDIGAVKDKSSFRDIDVLIYPHDLSEVGCVLMNSLKDNYDLINFVRNEYSAQYYFLNQRDKKILQIDLLPFLSYRGISYLSLPLSSEEIHYYQEIPFLSPRWMALYRLLRHFFWTGHLNKSLYQSIQQTFNSEPHFFKQTLRSEIGKHATQFIFHSLKTDSPLSRRKVLLNFLFYRIKCNPYQTLIGVFCHLYYLVLRFRYYPGLFMAILGMDGSGKSSVINQIADKRTLFPKVKVFHLFPGWFKRFRASGEESTPVRDPHGKESRNLVVSVMKLLVWWIEYVIGYIHILWKPAVEGNLILFDRYYHDLLVDSKRYRYGGPKWLARMIGKFLPSPKLMILLDLPPGIAQTRKQEISFEEGLRQRKAYIDMFEKSRNAYVIDASKAIEEVVENVEKQIQVFLVQRAQDRWRRFNNS